MVRHYPSFRVPYFVGASLVALSVSALAGFSLNDASQGISKIENKPALTKAAWRPSIIEAAPLQGFNIDFGTKYAMGYYQQVDDECKVVLSYAEPVNWEAVPMLVTTRMETTLSAEQWTSYMSHEGASLQFSCGSGARVLTVRALPRQYGG